MDADFDEADTDLHRLILLAASWISQTSHEFTLRLKQRL